MPIRTRSVYEAPGSDDGWRILVDRLWSRGLSKERAAIGWWPKEIAPSDELHRWFGHDPRRREEFRQLYFKKLTGRDEVVMPRLCTIICWSGGVRGDRPQSGWALRQLWRQQHSS